MINKYDLLDEQEFVLAWDDLRGEMEGAFTRIWSDLRQKYKLADDCQKRVLLNGWLGLKVHEIGFVTKLNK